MSLLAELAADLARHPGIALAAVDGSTMDVYLSDGNSYEVSLAEFDEDDPIGDEPMSRSYPRPDLVTDHATLLDAILYGMARSGLRGHVTGLTTDGDGSDCEAIFGLKGVPTILKIR